MLKAEKLQTIGKYLFIIAALIVIVNVIDIQLFMALAKDISWPYFFIVSFVVIFDQAFMGLKWNVLLRIFHVVVPFWVPVLAYLRGRIFTFVAPSSLGLDAYKTYVVKKYHNNAASIVSSIMVERGFGILSSLAIVLLMLPFCVPLFDFPLIEYVGWISIFGFTLLCTAIHFIQTKAETVLKLRFPKSFPETLHELLNKLVVNLAKVKHGQAGIWLYFFLSIVEKTAYGLAIYFSCLALGLHEIELLYILAAAPVVALLERLPISVSAIGLREGLIVVLLAPFYKDPTAPIAASLVLRAGEVVQMFIFSLTWFSGRSHEARDDEITQIERELADEAKAVSECSELNSTENVEIKKV